MAGEVGAVLLASGVGRQRGCLFCAVESAVEGAVECICSTKGCFFCAIELP